MSVPTPTRSASEDFGSPTRSVSEDAGLNDLAGGPYRFSVDQYHQMIAAGILTENDRVQLLEGEIVCMTPIGPLHRFSVQAAVRTLGKLLPPEWELMIQQPITLAASEPEPDIAIVRSEAARYIDRHPGPADVALVIEVADSSLDLDRSIKQRIYAAAGIPMYVLVNLAERQAAIMTQPLSAAGQEPASYQTHRIIDDRSAVAIELAGQRLSEICVADVMPPPVEGNT